MPSGARQKIKLPSQVSRLITSHNVCFRYQKVRAVQLLLHHVIARRNASQHIFARLRFHVTTMKLESLSLHLAVTFLKQCFNTPCVPF